MAGFDSVRNGEGTKVIAIQNRGIHVRRLNDGKPIIAADPNGWDDGFVLNPTAIRLRRSPQNDAIIRGLLGYSPIGDSRLQSGVVAVLYRGVPEERPGLPPLRSSVGLAVFTPEMELLRRFPYPVIVPTDDPTGCDYQGVEDQRITRIGDSFCLVYCGYNPCYSRTHAIRICLAVSDDLVHWTKLGPVRGNVNSVPNKDAVILPEPINGNYVMLHRPCVGWQGSLSIAMAVSDSPTGEWVNVGDVMKPRRDPRYSASWVGAGSAPLPLGGNRFLVDYHSGNYYASGDRDYFASYAVLNFDLFDPKRPEALVESRCEGVLRPETQYELDSPWPHYKTLNCVFPCGSYEDDDDIVLVYGGADAYVLAARLNRDELLSHLRAHACTRLRRRDLLPRMVSRRVFGWYPRLGRAARRIGDLERGRVREVKI